MKIKKLVIITLVLLVGAWFTYPKEEDTQVEEELVEETETVDSEVKQEQVEEEILEGPTETMEQWGTLTMEEKLRIIDLSLDYEKAIREEKNEPIKIVGTPEQFLKVIDARFMEIEAMEGYERLRMQSSTICAQVSIMGFGEHLIQFGY